MERYYRFAGVEITVDLPDDRMYENERRLTPFAVDRVEDPMCSGLKWWMR